MEKNLIYLHRKILFNFLCDIRLKETEGYLTPIEQATWNEVVRGVEYLLDEYDINTKQILENEE